MRNRLKNLFRSEISEMRAKMMKDEEAYTEYTATIPESFAGKTRGVSRKRTPRLRISEIAAEYGFFRRFLR